ncbi:MAG: LysM peptidoglycan-binding domain-containing protein [Chitinophagales bacterium]
MLKNCFLFVFLLLLSLPHLIAQADAQRSYYIDEHGSIIYYEKQPNSNKNITSPSVSPIPTYESVPVFSDEIYRARIEAIGANFDFPLTYNKYVRSYIHVYTVRKRDLANRILGYTDTYFPLFEQVLARHGLPTELKYLAIQESALRTTAVSRAGATGLWQLMKATAKELGLTVTTYVDERRDPYKSTDAAVRYLKRLHRKYGDWMLVIAAYNCGPGNVNKAIRRSGGKRNFWSIRRYLPRETRDYVPAYIACAYWTNHYLDHNLSPTYPAYPLAFNNTSTLKVTGKIDLDEMARALYLDPEKLAFMNPALRQKKMPYNTYTYDIHLPTSELYAFEQWRGQGSLRISNEYSDIDMNKIPTPSQPVVGVSETYTLDANGKPMAIRPNMPSSYSQRNTTTSATPDNVPANPNATSQKEATVLGKTPVFYMSRSGDTVEKIAEWYECSVVDLVSWNDGLNVEQLEVGQRIKIYVKSYEVSVAEKKKAKKTTTSKKTASKNSITYKVRRGDTLGHIADRNNCTVSDLRRWNPGISTRHLPIGKSLKIYTSASAAAKHNNGGSDIKAYIVRRGDTIWGIAKKHPGNSVESLLKLNNLRKNSKLKPGMPLKVKI